MNKKNFLLLLMTVFCVLLINYSLQTRSAGSQHLDSYVKFVSSSAASLQVQEEMQKILADSSVEAKLIAIYAAQVILKSNTTEYKEFWGQLEKDISNNSEAIYRVLSIKSEKIKENPFFHQIYLNLISDLKIEQTRKAKSIAKSLEQKMEFNPKDEITEQNASITVALILLKKSGYQIRDILPSIEKGLELNSSSNKSLKEFKIRVKTYINETNIQSVLR